MPIITLTTDWGIKDHYIGAVKGNILSQIPDARIVDISHSIDKHDLMQTSFIMKNTYKNFPDGTIHIIGVNSIASMKTPHSLVFADGHFFIGADNGIFSLILTEKPDKIIELDVIQESDYFTFSTRDVFIKTAAHIASGKNIEELGDVKPDLVQKLTFAPIFDDNAIIGKVIYIDSYENAITNITKKNLRDAGKIKKLKINFGPSSYEINSISDSYNDVPEGEMVAVFGTSEHMEIAINQGKASSLLGLGIDSNIRLEYSL